jgi:transposase-like protein
MNMVSLTTNIYSLTIKYREGSVAVWDDPELESPESSEVIELPAENVRRWTASRKAAVVNAVNLGEVMHEEICRRYQISREEFLSWQRDYESHGQPDRARPACSYIGASGLPIRPARRPSARHRRGV